MEYNYNLNDNGKLELSRAILDLAPRANPKDYFDAAEDATLQWDDGFHALLSIKPEDTCSGKWEVVKLKEDWFDGYEE